MKMDLNRDHLLKYIQKTSPNISAYTNPLVMKTGCWVGGNAWMWDKENLSKLSDEELFKLLQLCHNSWKK